MKQNKKDIINSFESAYEGNPPWEINRPQSELVRLLAVGEIHGKVLDVGCGTGEFVIDLVQRGYETIGVDISSAAIDKARRKAWAKKVHALFLVHDALYLEQLGIKFDTIIDSGLFHVFSDDARLKFVTSIFSSLRVGGTYLMLCFSEHEPPGWGPRRVTKPEIYESFKNGFKINYMREVNFETNLPQGTAKAWLASIKKSQ